MSRRRIPSPSINRLRRQFVGSALLLVLLASCDDPDGVVYVEGDEVTLGTHTYRAVLPDEFSDFETGQDVDVVLGTQGSLMVVAAVRTNRVPFIDEPFTVTIAIADPSGEEFSRLSMRRYPTLESDNMMYFSNLYAVITANPNDGAYSWDGELATLTIVVKGVDGTEYIDESMSLRLRASDEIF